MGAPALEDPVRPPAVGVVAWVVSPHALVAQAVAEALRSTGAPVEFRSWEQLQRARPAPGGVLTHVLVIVDGVDPPELVEEINHFVSAGGARVALVTSAPDALVWGGLLHGSSVDVVTMTTSVGQLAEVVDRFLAGGTLMSAETRKALRAEWLEALDKRRHLVSRVRELSRQQLRVLELLASGRRVPEVAQVMGIADGTVRSHVKTLRSKLGARTQLEAVAMLHQVQEMGVGETHDLVPRPREEAGDPPHRVAPLVSADRLRP